MTYKDPERPYGIPFLDDLVERVQAIRPGLRAIFSGLGSLACVGGGIAEIVAEGTSGGSIAEGSVLVLVGLLMAVRSGMSLQEGVNQLDQ